VEENQIYLFTYYLRTCYTEEPATLRCTINGIQVGIAVTPELPADGWLEVSYEWHSGSNTEADIRLVDLNYEHTGNDFTIDDISLLQQHCETAYAYSGDDALCFIDYGFSNWGWIIPLAEEGIYVFDIYAGAGQCDLTKGTLVGTAIITRSATTVTVVYDLEEGYTLYESHVYAGVDPLPHDKKGNPTVAPGQYRIEENLVGEIYVIAHAVVCWYE
jgi:hypothetical protein